MTIYKNIPINKGNYSMDTDERDHQFEKNKSLGWEKEYNVYRKIGSNTQNLKPFQNTLFW